MQTLFRDVLLSFCPAEAREKFRPESPVWVRHAALWTGLLQFSLLTLVSVLRFKSFFMVRAQQLAPQVAGRHEVVQAGVTLFVVLEYLIHPLSAFLAYLAFEGLLRFFAAIVPGEVVPSLPVTVAFKIQYLLARRRQKQQARIPDTFETLSDGRLRIASALRKPTWTASMTIGIRGEWHEVEREERGAPPRNYVYLLRHATAGRILRGFEEYDLASAVTGTNTLNLKEEKPGSGKS